MSITIDRRAGLSENEFQTRYVSQSLPVILTDAIDNWPARKKWDLDYFKTRFGDKTVYFDRTTWEVGRLIDALRHPVANQHTPYLKEVKLDEQFTELWDDIGEMRLARGNRLQSRLLPDSMRIKRGIVALFIGAQGSGFRKLHWDYSYLHAFISQVHGGKDAILFPPTDTPYLYTNPRQAHLSTIPDPFVVDPSAFPEFARASPTFVTIAEGETLFIPGGWWHATSIKEPSIAIAESTLDHHNWGQRSQFYLEQHAQAKTPLLKRMALAGYMALLDHLL